MRTVSRRGILSLASLCLVTVLLPLALRANPADDKNSIATQLPGRNALLMGTDWYPEQWPESRWDTDLAMMEAAHLDIIRIAEFAWSRLEPSEGHFDFDWLDRAISLAAKHHIAVVIGTPTAGP